MIVAYREPDRIVSIFRAGTELALFNRGAGLLLAQDRNDLLFREPRSLHRPVLPRSRTLPSHGRNCGGHVTITTQRSPANARRLLDAMERLEAGRGQTRELLETD